MDMQLIEQIVEQGYIFIEDYYTISQCDEPVINKRRVQVYQVSIKRYAINLKNFTIHAVIETPYGDFNVNDRNVTWWLTDPSEEDTIL